MESDRAGFGGDAVTQQSPVVWMQCLSLNPASRGAQTCPALPWREAWLCRWEGLAVGSHRDGAVQAAAVGAAELGWDSSAHPRLCPQANT